MVCAGTDPVLGGGTGAWGDLSNFLLTPARLGMGGLAGWLRLPFRPPEVTGWGVGGDLKWCPSSDLISITLVIVLLLLDLTTDGAVAVATGEAATAAAAADVTDLVEKLDLGEESVSELGVSMSVSLEACKLRLSHSLSANPYCFSLVGKHLLNFFILLQKCKPS